MRHLRFLVRAVIAAIKLFFLLGVVGFVADWVNGGVTVSGDAWLSEFH